MSESLDACEHWDPGACEGDPHCPPRCPRFVDERGEPWVVRPYGPSDRDALGDMYADFDRDQRAQGIPPLDERRREEWLDMLVEEGCNLVVTDGERVVGHALYTPTDAAVPELAVFVHQDYQRRGIGTELCRHVVATASAAGRDALVLDVEPWNRAAIGVYERVGFQRTERTEDPGHPAQSLRMCHPLSGGSAAAARRPPALRG